MKIALAADHRGYEMKEMIKGLLEERGHEAVDFGTHSTQSVDYPDMVFPAARAVARGDCDMGIFVCGTGIGVSIVANKVPGVYAARCCSEKDAEMSRKHNNANVMTLSGTTQADVAKRMVLTFLETGFERGRHQRRIDKIKQAETGHLSGN